jgi:hypothetical protein
MVGGLYLVKEFYQYQSGKYFPQDLVLYSFAAFTIIWMIALWIFGAYDRPFRYSRIWKGAGVGWILILITYSLLPENLRFSRAIVLMGIVSTLPALFLVRHMLGWIWPLHFKFASERRRRYAVVGSAEEIDRVKQLLNRSGVDLSYVTSVIPLNSAGNGNAGIEELPEIIRVHKTDEVVFCAKDLSAQGIMESMSTLVDSGIDFKIAPPESLYIIGSNSVQTPGDLFVLDVNSVNRQSNRRAKRSMDLVLSIILFIISPLMLVFVRSFFGFLANNFEVLIGKKSWVGYAAGGSSLRLPRLKKGVVAPVPTHFTAMEKTEAIDRLNVIYAKDYKIVNDLKIIWRSRKELGNR